jgi:hypothetical protein
MGSLLLWVVSYISKEPRENTSDDSISKMDKDAKLISCHECCIKDQHPHLVNQLPLAVYDCLFRRVPAKCFLIPISEGIRKLYFIKLVRNIQKGMGMCIPEGSMHHGGLHGNQAGSECILRDFQRRSRQGGQKLSQTLQVV